MIHDFAKSPRTYILTPQAEPTPRPLPARRLPKGRWLVLALIIASIIFWKTTAKPDLAEPEFIPGEKESSEYQAALDQQEREQAEISQRLATEKKSAADEQKRLVAALQEKMELHPAQEPKFGFYDSLSGSAWSVPVQRGVYVTEEDRKRARNQRYMLQAASVRDLGEAQRIVQRLRQLSLQAFYTNDESGGWYRINVGPFDNVSKMNKAEDILVSLRMMPLKRKL